MKRGTMIGLGIGIVAACGVGAVLLYRRGKRVEAAQGTTQTTSGTPAPTTIVDTITRGLKALGDDIGVTSHYEIDSAGQPIIGHYESSPTFAQRAVSGLYTTATMK
jgi:hypothetical protein